MPARDDEGEIEERAAEHQLVPMGRGLVSTVEGDDAGKARFVHDEPVVLVGAADDLDAGEDCRQRQVDISAVKKLQRVGAEPAFEGAAIQRGGKGRQNIVAGGGKRVGPPNGRKQVTDRGHAGPSVFEGFRSSGRRAARTIILHFNVVKLPCFVFLLVLPGGGNSAVREPLPRSHRTAANHSIAELEHGLAEHSGNSYLVPALFQNRSTGWSSKGQPC